MFPSPDKFFLPYQTLWKNDKSTLRICEKGRQVGLSYVDQYDSVLKAAIKHGKDVWVVSRDESQAKQYIAGCKRWARALGYATSHYGEEIFTLANGNPVKIQVLTFASRASIYALSSNPDAIVGKTGHVKLDEFALHKDQRTLYAVAKPVTQWGGTLSIISTHRGPNSVFNQIITDIKKHGNPMHWSLHSVPIQLAVEHGIVAKINAATGQHHTRESFLSRLKAECIDEEQWLQEYCCVPADESTAFLSYEIIHGCEDNNLHLHSLAALEAEFKEPRTDRTFYLGVDVARKNDLCVLDLGERIGDVHWDRLRIELKDTPFPQIRSILYELLRLPGLERACIDASGLGIQLAEEAKYEFAWKVEPVTFTAPLKEELAFALKAAFEDRKLRIPYDDKLRADLRGLKKLVTSAGNIRFAGDCDDSHCDRTWALALRLHAAITRCTIGSRLG